LIITERNDLLNSVMWEGTDKYLQHYRDQFMMNNNGQVYFLVPWLGIKNRKDISSWIAYEKHASRVWECVVSKVNHGLVWKQSSPVYILLANIALTELVKHLLNDSIVGQFSYSSYSDRLDLLFSDDVHLTRFGVYYI
jgi:hypothetical protein